MSFYLRDFLWWSYHYFITLCSLILILCWHLTRQCYSISIQCWDGIHLNTEAKLISKHLWMWNKPSKAGTSPWTTEVVAVKCIQGVAGAGKFLKGGWAIGEPSTHSAVSSLTRAPCYSTSSCWQTRVLITGWVTRKGDKSGPVSVQRVQSRTAQMEHRIGDKATMYVQGGHSGDGSGDHLPQDYLWSSPEALPEDRKEVGMGVTTAQLEQDSRLRTELK